MNKPRKHINQNNNKGEARRGKASSTKTNKAEVKQSTKPTPSKPSTAKTNKPKTTKTNQRGSGGVPQQSRQPRKLNKGLAAWNTARSYISKENRKNGRKFNRVELDALTKGFLLEQYGRNDFDYTDLDSFLRKDVPSFYDNLLLLDQSALYPTQFYLMDQKLQMDMPRSMDIVINAGPLGVLSFNMASYDYHGSGLAEIVESVRDILFPTGKTVSLDDMNGFFDGFLRPKVAGQTKKKKKGEELGDKVSPDILADPSKLSEYYVEWVLFLYDEYVEEGKPFVDTAEFPIPEVGFRPSDLFKRRHKGKGKEKLKKLAERIKTAKTPGAKITAPAKPVKSIPTVSKPDPAIKKLAAENKKLKAQLNKQSSEISELKAMMATLIKQQAETSRQQAELISALKPKKSRKK